MNRKSGHRIYEKTTLNQKDKARLQCNLNRSGLMVAELRTILAADDREEALRTTSIGSMLRAWPLSIPNVGS
jgi:hypothetical protein